MQNVIITIFPDATVHFSESTYTVRENFTKIKPVLFLSNLVSFDINVTVESKDKTAIG